MLDKKSTALLELLYNKTENSYKVLNKGQLIDELPKKLKVDEQGFSAIVAFLKENEYVDVKYQDKDEICVSTTIKAESYLEGEKDLQQKAKITNTQATLWECLLRRFWARSLRSLSVNLSDRSLGA